MTSQTIITESEFVLVVEQESEPSIITTEVEIVVLVENTEVVLLEATEQGPAGVAEIATQGETDAGTDDTRIVTPLKLATSVFGTKKFNQNIGDGSATSYVVTHSLNTRDVEVEVIRNSGNYDTVLVEVQRTSVNAVTIVFDVAPTSNAFRVLIRT